MLNPLDSVLGIRQRGRVSVITRILLIAALVCAMIGSFFNHSPKTHAAAPAVPTGWTDVFTDDFNGPANTGVNTGNWRYTTGTGYPGGPVGFGTGEVETMTASTANVFLDGAGNLNIKAIRGGNGVWTSGRIETNRADFQPPAGGILHVESRMQLPNVTGAAGQGYWPAFWMLGEPYRGNWWNWPGIGEIDIMENVQGLNQVWGTMHCGTSPGGPCNEKSGIGNNKAGFNPSLQTAFHTYAIEWDRSASPEIIRWYIDGVQYHQVSQNQVDAGTWANATNHGYFVILNLAMGGEFPAALGGGPTGATASGGTLKVDYVAVWSKVGSGGGGGGGTAAPIPGKIEAENFNAMNGIQTEPTTDAGGGLDVGWIESGDWMDYNVNVQTAGNYTVQYRVAAQTAAGSIQLQKGGAVLATSTVPVTGGWQNWTTVSATVNLSAGQQTLRLFAGTGGFNINWMNFVSAGGGGGGGGGGTTVETPVFNPPGGTYASAQSVTISTATADAQIRYTTNGTAPTASSPLYTAPITVSSTQTISAIGIKAGLANSAVASAAYTISAGGGGGGTGTEWTYGVDNVSANQAKIWFKPTGFTSGYVIVHYTRPGLAQQNLNMAFNGGAARWETTVTGITAGQLLNYGFTYSKNGTQYDTPFYNWTKP